jgi:hypothetical protein
MMKAIVLSLLILVSCTFGKVEHRDRPNVQMVVLDPSLQEFSVLWQHEIERRYPKAVGILCHGGDLVDGDWVVKVANGNHILMKAADLVKHYKEEYPDRQIVFLACNTGHLKLNVPGVVYSHSSVWCCPDRDVSSHPELQYLKMDGKQDETNGNRSELEPDVVGNVFEMEAD